jgi:hypothetical protein
MTCSNCKRLERKLKKAERNAAKWERVADGLDEEVLKVTDEICERDSLVMALETVGRIVSEAVGEKDHDA